MKELNNLKDVINDYRNSARKELNKEELIELDAYIDKVINDLEPAIKILEKIRDNGPVLKELKTQLDETMRKEKWLEKLLKTS